MIKNIFFDFDGVLAESVNIKTEAFRQMYLLHGQDFAQRVVDYHIANGGISRYEKFKLYNGEWLGEELTQEKLDTLANTFSELVLEGVVNAKEVEGALDFLNNSDEYKMYIITGTPTIEIVPILERRKMEHFFLKVCGSPEKKDFWVKKIIEEEELDPRESVFVGDALTDYNAAVANDVTFILRETPEGEMLFRDYNGYRLKDMRNLQNVIDEINKNLENA